MKDNVKATGKAKFKLTRADGTQVSWLVDNLVVTVGKNHIADQLAAQLEAAMSHMAIGEGTTLQTLTDTALETEVSRKVFTSKDQGTGGNANQIIYITDWGPGEGTGAITEAGIFNNETAGVMLTRTTFAVKNKDAGDSLSIQWTLTIG